MQKLNDIQNITIVMIDFFFVIMLLSKNLVIYNYNSNQSKKLFVALLI